MFLGFPEPLGPLASSDSCSDSNCHGHAPSNQTCTVDPGKRSDRRCMVGSPVHVGRIAGVCGRIAGVCRLSNIHRRNVTVDVSLGGSARRGGAMGWDQRYTPLTRPRLNTSSVRHKAQTPSNNTCYYFFIYFFRFSARKVQKVDTLRWFLTGLVTLDIKFDLLDQSGRSRAVCSCQETS